MHHSSQHSTYHGLCYISCGALSGMKNGWVYNNFFNTSKHSFIKKKKKKEKQIQKILTAAKNTGKYELVCQHKRRNRFCL